MTVAESTVGDLVRKGALNWSEHHEQEGETYSQSLSTCLAGSTALGTLLGWSAPAGRWTAVVIADDAMAASTAYVGV